MGGEGGGPYRGQRGQHQRIQGEGRGDLNLRGVAHRSEGQFDRPQGGGRGDAELHRLWKHQDPDGHRQPCRAGDGGQEDVATFQGPGQQHRHRARQDQPARGSSSLEDPGEPGGRDDRQDQQGP